MGRKNHRSAHGAVWLLAKQQHGVVARRQLLAMGYTRDAIGHRIDGGRLHRISQGVYAVGRPEIGAHGRWMAAVLSCGTGCILSHASAAALWAIRPVRSGEIEVSVLADSARRRPGIVVHRRPMLPRGSATEHLGIPVTTPICTLVDIATRLRPAQLEAAVNEADKRDLTDPEALRSALDAIPPRAGVGRLRKLLDRRTFTLTDSQLERLFLPIARQAGLPAPETGSEVNGYRVDFYWPHLGLVVETDGLRYHRTPGQQAKDRIRDQVHMAAGLTPVRFTRAQVKYERAHVRATLEAVARHLLRRRPE
jgi:very-short-patch-repair endonuclease